MKNILVRSDSSSQLGIGHIMRDLVLVKQYANANIIFACQDLEGNINSKIKKLGYKVKILKSNNIKELNYLIKKIKVDILIIDHYSIDYTYEKELKNQNSKLKILSFDDTYEKHFCDILLNHNVYADSRKYKELVPSNCELRCGSKYTLIRDEFRNIKQVKTKNKRKKVLICFGGSDIDNISLQVLKSIINYKTIKIIVLVTSANKNIKSLKKFVKEYNNIKLVIDSLEIAKIINKANLTIVSPSTILHEIKYLNKKFIAIQTASNQKFMIKYLEKHKEKVMNKFSKTKFQRIFKKELKLI